MDSNKNPRRIRKRLINHLGRVSLAFISVALMATPANASDPAVVVGEVLGNEGGKLAVLNAALKVARSKPAMSTATGIVCLSCVPAAGVAASPALCIACGILISKTLG